MKGLTSLLQEKSTLLGTFVISNSPLIVEMIGLAGFDFVIIDCEHSATSPYGTQLENMLRASGSRKLPSLVRVLENDYGQIVKCLDLGAEGIIVPHICNRFGMEEAMNAAARPPRGQRGAAPVVRAADFGMGDWQAYLRSSRSPPFIGPLIEDVEGVEKIDEILDVDGIGFVFFGAFDLAVSMGKDDPRSRDEDVEMARRKVYASARGKGVPLADYAWDGKMAQEFISLGANIIAMSNDISVLGSGLRSLLESVEQVD